MKSAQDKAFATEAYERAATAVTDRAAHESDQRHRGPEGHRELQGRITSEQAMIQNEATKLQMFQIIAQAEDAVQSARRTNSRCATPRAVERSG